MGTFVFGRKACHLLALVNLPLNSLMLYGLGIDPYNAVQLEVFTHVLF